MKRTAFDDVLLSSFIDIYKEGQRGRIPVSGLSVHLPVIPVEEKPVDPLQLVIPETVSITILS